MRHLLIVLSISTFSYFSFAEELSLSTHGEPVSSPSMVIDEPFDRTRLDEWGANLKSQISNYRAEQARKIAQGWGTAARNKVNQFFNRSKQAQAMPEGYNEALTTEITEDCLGLDIKSRLSNKVAELCNFDFIEDDCIAAYKPADDAIKMSQKLVGEAYELSRRSEIGAMEFAKQHQLKLSDAIQASVDANNTCGNAIKNGIGSSCFTVYESIFEDPGLHENYLRHCSEASVDMNIQEFAAYMNEEGDGPAWIVSNRTKKHIENRQKAVDAYMQLVKLSKLITRIEGEDSKTKIRGPAGVESSPRKSPTPRARPQKSAQESYLGS